MKKKMETLIQCGLGNQLYSFTAGYSMIKLLNQDLVLDFIDYENGNFRPLKFNDLNVNYKKKAFRLPLSFISNSSFAWWGTWLNSDEEKLVIVPETPYLNGTDYYSEEWLKISTKMESLYE